MRSLQKCKLWLLTSLGISALGACQVADKSELGGGEVAVNQQVKQKGLVLRGNLRKLDFRSHHETRSIPLKLALPEWHVREKEDVDWLEIEKEGNKAIKLNVATNLGDDVRTATIILSGEDIREEIEVRQLGVLPEILLSIDELEVPAVGGPVAFTVTTNVEDFEIKHPEWIKEQSLRLAELRDLPHNYIALDNKLETVRLGEIEVVERGVTERKPLAKKISIKQRGLSDYKPYSLDKLPDDVKLKIKNGTATSHQPGENIEKAFDGVYNNLYHSKWNKNAVVDRVPITLTLNLEWASDVDYMVYYPRHDSSTNGNFGKVDIEYSTDGTNFRHLQTTDFEIRKTPTRVDFEQRLIGVKSFRLIVKTGGADHASAAEIEFYKKSPQSFDYTSLFKDEVCSELKEGLTEEQILSCPDEFYRNLAYYIYHNKYDTEFRVAEYKAYPNPDIQAKQHKTTAYSLFDNPTGMAVEAGEDLAVIVGNTHGFNKLALCVLNLDKPEGDGFYDKKTYPLYRGLNKVKLQNSGLAYIMYHVNSLDVEELPKIKVHFAGGTVNGYFDHANPEHKGRWQELLGKASNKYFDVLGEYVHMTFPTAAYRNLVPKGEDLVERYDKTVKAEMTLLGLYKENNTPKKNRMYMQAMYKSYMYATSYHTAYNVTTLPAILDMSKWAIWGPAHEIGHMNQTRPGVLWRGMTECTVNIKSAYVQTTIFGRPCRLWVEDMDKSKPHNRYTKAWNAIIVPKLPHAYGNQGTANSGDTSNEAQDQANNPSDVFCQLVPFWQLELYFGKVLGMTPDFDGAKKDGFYPNLYEYFRNNPSAPNIDKQPQHGHHQTEFAYVASKISGYDLTDFFDKWGFLKPVDKMVNDYANERVHVTPERVQEVKNRIKAEGLRSLGNVPIEYITDNTVELFKTNPPMTAGVVTWTEDKNTLSFDGSENVVAYEVVDTKNNNAIVFIGDGSIEVQKQPKKPRLFLPTSVNWKSGNYKVLAVSSTGERVPVSEKK